jgi:hypothetical protein
MKSGELFSTTWITLRVTHHGGRLEPTVGKGRLAGPIDIVRTTLFSVRQQSQKSTRTQKSGHYRLQM